MHALESAAQLQAGRDLIESGREVDLPCLSFEARDTGTGEIELNTAVPGAAAVRIDEDGGIIHIKEHEDAFFPEEGRRFDVDLHIGVGILGLQPFKIAVTALIQDSVERNGTVVFRQLFNGILKIVWGIVGEIGVVAAGGTGDRARKRSGG